MAKENKNNKSEFQNRRYVGRRETLAYVLFDVSKDFNINQYGNRFVLDVLKLELDRITIVNVINSIWDVVNDTFIGVLVDKTRTRWGKFKPYLIAFAIPGTITACLYWMAPLFLSEDPNDITKFIFWLILALVREGGATFRSVAETGMLATITPHPVDRTRLITIAQLMSGILGKQLPEITMGILIDLINHKVINIKLRSAYVSMGVSTALLSCVLAFFFFSVTRERVVQPSDSMDIKTGIKSILTNKPILLITLSEFLGAFSISTGMDNYYIDVLGAASIKNIVGIPGAFVSPLSYTYVPWARKRFSTKALWIVGGSFGSFLMAIVFLVGSIGGSGAKGLYNKAAVMIPAIMIQETLWTSIWGIKNVIPVEMFNEAMDYCEWKNGYRTEGMTSTARGLASKLVKSVSGSFQTSIMKRFDYSLDVGFGQQSYRAKYALFAMGTIIPFVTSLLGIIPKFFYDLTGAKREMMYLELLSRRAEKQKELSTGFKLPDDIQAKLEDKDNTKL